MKDYEGLIYMLVTAIWIGLFFICKHYGEKWVFIYFGCTFTCIGIGLLIAGVTK